MCEELSTSNNERTDSIKVSRTTAGKYSWEIKCYYNPAESNEGFIIQKIEAINMTLKDKFKDSD
jgi:hypothetical protein